MIVAAIAAGLQLLLKGAEWAERKAANTKERIAALKARIAKNKDVPVAGSK
jgi:hypothetical protein